MGFILRGPIFTIVKIGPLSIKPIFDLKRCQIPR
jgi:hypothetical protein